MTRVGFASLAAFLVVLALLAIQLRAGRDPALGDKGAKPAARRVLVRRIVRRVVVIHVIPPSSQAAAATPSGSGPAVPSSAPVVSAPAPAPLPPAPVTRSS